MGLLEDEGLGLGGRYVQKPPIIRAMKYQLRVRTHWMQCHIVGMQKMMAKSTAAVVLGSYLYGPSEAIVLRKKS